MTGLTDCSRNFLLLVFALSFQCLRGMPICSPKPPHSTGDTAHLQLGQRGGRWDVANLGQGVGQAV